MGLKLNNFKMTQNNMMIITKVDKEHIKKYTRYVEIGNTKLLKGEYKKGSDVKFQDKDTKLTWRGEVLKVYKDREGIDVYIY